MSSYRSLQLLVNTGIKHAEKEYDGLFGAGTLNDFLNISPADVNNSTEERGNEYVEKILFCACLTDYCENIFNFALYLAEEKEV